MGIVFHRNKRSQQPLELCDAGPETEEYRTRMALLYEIAQEAGSVSAVSGLLERILHITRQTLDASDASLLLIDEEDGRLFSHSQVVFGDNGITLRQKDLDMESGITGWVARNAVPVVTNDVGMDSRFDVITDINTDSGIRSIVAIPVTKGNRVIGVLEAYDKRDGSDFKERDVMIMKGFASTEALILLVSMSVMAIDNINNVVLDQALMQGYRSTAEAWASAVDNRDSYAYAHSRRVAEYTLLAAGCFSFSPRELQDIEFGALFHDIGKIGIDNSILCKPGPLTDIEWLVMHEHSRKGASIVGEIPFLREAKDIVLHHHEKYDGTGYPDNLSGSSIPIGARLVAVADAFDTMTTDHSYRPAQSAATAISELIEGIGTQFCPVAVEAFISAVKKRQMTLVKGKSIKKAARDNNEAVHNHKKPKKTACLNAAELYKGDIRLVVPLTVGSREVRRFREHLENTENLKVTMTGGSEKEGHFIMLSLQKPIEFVRIIGEMPMTENIEKCGKDILVTLRSSNN